MASRKSQRPTHFSDLPLEDRVLIYLVDRDAQRGRGDSVRTVATDATDAVYTFSSAYLHWAFEVIANTVAWSELREFSSQANPVLSMPPGHQAFASLPAGMRQRYRNVFKRLVATQEAYAFAEWFRALQGLGGKLVPMLSLWTPSSSDPISAISLTESGFARAQSVAAAFREVRPWQLHEFIVTVPGFLDKMRGKA